ncbi:signal transduction histidine kinase [Nakamurella sp. UYEF19]|uniref:sensor histidine kinase n=1 Tax=Nakamurella sp. UYEF19 TaxID=1756392 RepID=UPI003399826B
MRKHVYRWFEQHVWAGDAILGVLMLVALVFSGADLRYSDAEVFPLLVLSAGPVFLRRSATRSAVTMAIALLGLNVLLVGEATAAVVLAPLMVHAAVAYTSGRFWGRFALAAGLLGSVAAPLRWGYRSTDNGTLTIAIGLCAVVVIAAFVIGERQRDRVEFQAEQLRVLDERSAMLAAERDQRARIAASTERTRIARELHDIVAHSLSVVIVQADGAAAAAAARPELAVSVLHTIADTGREALAEMRRLVGVLRAGDVPGSAPTGYAPAQGVADLPALIEQVRQTGVAVSMTLSGDRIALPAGLGLTIYRLVQEALTNVLKHAGPVATASVALEYRPGVVEISVTDDGRGGASEPGFGHGLLGMRERVWLQGGRLAVGPRTGGGYRVHASFPLQSNASGNASGYSSGNASGASR